MPRGTALHRVRHGALGGEQERASPSRSRPRRRPSAATNPRPSWNPPAASTGMSTASHTCESRRLVGTVPVWPPPSAPCAITASTPQAATFSAWRRARDGRHHDDTFVLQHLHESLARRLGKARDLHSFAHHELDAVVDVRLVGAQVHAERLVGPALDLVDRLGQLVEGHRGAREDAETARRARRGRQPRPGHPAHPGLDDRQLHPEELTGPRLQRRVRRHLGALRSPHLVPAPACALMEWGLPARGGP